MTRLGNILGKCGHIDYIYASKERYLGTGKGRMCRLACAHKWGIRPEIQKLDHPNLESEQAVQLSE